MENIDIILTKDFISHIYSREYLEQVCEFLCEEQNIYVIIDKNLISYYNSLKDKLNFKSFYVLEATESNKDILNVMKICSWLLENNANRDAFLLGIGGGITTDITGFAASIYKRGIRFGFIPTTLLAQVDAAIGGKNGANFMDYKNIVGTINQPNFIFECSEVLNSLPYDEFIYGAAELIKTFIIDNQEDNYNKAIKILKAINHSENKNKALMSYSKELSQLIFEAAKIKADFVSRDPFEKDERRKLNLGHTFAHAIEWKSNHSISHGEAVAIGMILAAKVSDYLQSDTQISEKLISDFEACGLNTKCQYDICELIEAIKKDKKAENDKVNFVLIKEIGNVYIKALTPNILKEIFKNK